MTRRLSGAQCTALLASVLGLGAVDVLTTRLQPKPRSTAEHVALIDAANAKRARKNAKRAQNAQKGRK